MSLPTEKILYSIPLAPTSNISLCCNFMMFYCKEISRNKIFKILYSYSIADVEAARKFILFPFLHLSL